MKLDGDYASILKKVSLPIVNDIECNQKFRASRLGRKFTLHKSMICAGGEQGQDTCKGDGGGPLICPSKNDPNTYLQVTWKNCFLIQANFISIYFTFHRTKHEYL